MTDYAKEASRDYPCQSVDSAATTEAPESPSKSWRFKLLWASGAVLLALLTCMGLSTAGVLPVDQTSAPTDNLIPVKRGDTILFGRYNDAPIEWRVLRIEDNKKEPKAILVSKYILTMKAFDAAESGSYNHDGTRDYYFRDSPEDTDMELQAYVHGNSDWSSSNIRAWLNAQTEVVTYTGQAPTSAAMSDHRNGYQNEPGFLFYFTEAERAALAEHENHTPGNALAASEDIVTYDKVFLLSSEELSWFDEADVSKLAEPTPEALEQTQCNWYQLFSAEYGIKEYYWWLRDPVKNAASKGYLVENGYDIPSDAVNDHLIETNVGLEGYGIRPAIAVKLSAAPFRQAP